MKHHLRPPFLSYTRMASTLVKHGTFLKSCVIECTATTLRNPVSSSLFHCILKLSKCALTQKGIKNNAITLEAKTPRPLLTFFASVSEDAIRRVLSRPHRDERAAAIASKADTSISRMINYKLHRLNQQTRGDTGTT